MRFVHAIAHPPPAAPRAAITAVATYVPERRVTNAELAPGLDTSDDWIVSRTGIHERRIGAPGETTSTMGAEAVRRLMAQRGLGPEDIGALIVATVTPDMIFPATACLIQDQVGLVNTWGFDLSAACSGFLYALTTGAQFVAAGTHRRVVVVGADLMSAIIDPLDRTTAVLFGDGAGAVLLEPAEPGYGLLDFYHRVDGSGRDDLLMPAGGSASPGERRDGRGARALSQAERQGGLQVRRVADGRLHHHPPHAPPAHPRRHRDGHPAPGEPAHPRRHRRAAGACPPGRMATVIGRYGNTTAATLPLALDDVLQDGRLKRGDLVIFVAVGAGFTVGATLMRWQ